MGLLEIEAKIIGEAEAKAGEIKTGADKEAAAIIAAAKARSAAIREEMLGQARQQAEEEKKGIVVPARLLLKQRLLEEKHRQLDRLFSGIDPSVREEKESEVIKILYG
ncbi:hypothetical protein A3K48_00250 [candidate division WOR-1 bacterium RIFOXYA12_FULL_52_29]|uniref:V-type ATP synthase subunit E n=1 Tax=candidate division WOR-1 bacterium RIFOXYC12_FULL_54_18 TaxID=1802584 RepID=A0A1F4T5V3_UNCSA|nr:MAG: hypothetical protein A3K44_00250 [candidate division WOR-1 bacterium RIFOXYA2_FULL_51_19]OGC17036.1 MAG: hypothetical protein A3K48_00250 [candidate division WOR-1 bacterium RIFOXYA12_FULL_52_29]OGC25897.1 MAG: hypothetical protein A3K32_00250 [candidate division WOR-1 bacterium RIFOXYB2_FULL_45_9]OGC27453.1 MAG: hypothetical protein A3K49_00250 [candidate division WOR-1 bacterium RIFOXYC12_FULL_54_18]OGC29334.1 MAG: hypothetical protein A2346_01455 [candidate division WOR-1 bacterium R